MNNLKKCSKCGEIKHVDMFGKDSHKKDGLRTNCRICKSLENKAYKINNQERLKKYNSSYRIKHKEIEKERKSRWIASRDEKWKEEKRIKSRVTDASYRSINKEKIKKSNQLYREKNKEALRIKAQNRRARKKQNGGSLSRGIATRLFNLQKGKCACCKMPLGDKYHMDHIIPISKGGRNEDSNIQLLRAECNIKKSAKDPIEFMQSKGYLL